MPGNPQNTEPGLERIEIMAVGNTINYSIPVVGSTVASFARSDGNQFLKTDYAIGGSPYPATFTIRPSSTAVTNKRRFGVTFVTKPSASDNPGSLTLGTVTVSVNIDAVLGSAVTTTNLAAAVRHALAATLHSALIEDLSQGTAL